MKVLFFDTETTGIKSKWNPGFVPALVQLSAILQDDETGRVYGEINLINRDCGEIPVEASNVHGITQALAEEVGIDMDVLEDVFISLAKHADRLVAHNIEFDMDIIKDNMPEVWDMICLIPQYCTKVRSTMVVRAPLTDKQLAYFKTHPEKKEHDFKGPTLAEAYRHFFGKDFEGAHDAAVDTRACRDVYFALNKR